MTIYDYLRIPYKHLGRTTAGCDCLGLILLYYAEERGIVLPDFTDYQPNWQQQGYDYFVEMHGQWPFVEVRVPKEGDVVLLRDTEQRVGHCGIVTAPGERYFLHTTYNGTVQSSWAAAEYCNRVYAFLRYRGTYDHQN